MEEIWIDIKDYEGLYMISSYGRIKSLGNDKKRKEKILKPSVTNRGYYIVGLCNNNVVKIFTVHRLVAETFIPNPHNLTEVNHKDENKTNNNVFNLEWCDRKYNINYGKRNKKVSDKLSTPVLQYTKDGQFVAEYQSMIDAERKTGFNKGNICECCNGKRISTSGYVWRYKGDCFDKYETKSQENKTVLQYTKDGQFIAEYPSIIEASRQTGINQGNICRCCRNKRKTAGGYKWKYKN